MQLLSHNVVTLGPVRMRCIAISVSVCLCVCLSVHCISWKAHVQALPNFFVHISPVWGSFLLWRQCNKLCTSGFVDDVIVFT